MHNWYILQTFSGFEQKIAETIKNTVKKQNLDEKIQEVLDGLNKLNIPTWIIGEILSSPERQMIDKNNKVQEIPRPVSDEILRFM